MSGSRPDNVLTLGSLFSGIGGLEYGLEMTGRFKTVWQVEKDAYCRKVLAKHWPDVTRYEDVKDVGRETISAVDVICGGFPCQDVSTAGQGAGIREGTRSGLWYEFVRIIREVGPRYAIVENVTGLLANGMGIVLSDLAESGYDAKWSVFSAEGVGAPHLRERVFIVAHAEKLLRNGRHDHTAGNRKGPPSFSQPGDGDGSAYVADAGSIRSAAGMARPKRGQEGNAGVPVYGGPEGSLWRPELGWWSTEPDVGRVAHGVPSRVDRLKSLGNAVVPQCARVVGEWLLEIHDELTAVA